MVARGELPRVAIDSKSVLPEPIIDCEIKGLERLFMSHLFSGHGEFPPRVSVPAT
jgi:hypothetical protein